MESLKQKFKFCGDIEDVIYQNRLRLNHTTFFHNDKIIFFAPVTWCIEYTQENEIA